MPRVEIWSEHKAEPDLHPGRCPSLLAPPPQTPLCLLVPLTSASTRAPGGLEPVSQRLALLAPSPAAPRSPFRHQLSLTSTRCPHHAAPGTLSELSYPKKAALPTSLTDVKSRAVRCRVRGSDHGKYR